MAGWSRATPWPLSTVAATVLRDVYSYCVLNFIFAFEDLNSTVSLDTPSPHFHTIVYCDRALTRRDPHVPRKMPDGENDTRVPVTVLTGLLGSDKTTLLKRGVRSLRRPSRGVHIRSATITPPQAPSGTPSRGVGKPCTACPLVCYFFGLEGVRRPLNLALLAETRARGPDGSRTCACRNWHGARATSSVDGWASMALRSHVVEAAGVRTSERRRAWADSSKLASEPDAE